MGKEKSIGLGKEKFIEFIEFIEENFLFSHIFLKNKISFLLYIQLHNSCINKK